MSRGLSKWAISGPRALPVSTTWQGTPDFGLALEAMVNLQVGTGRADSLTPTPSVGTRMASTVKVERGVENV
jgi:hypothetical protein